MNVDVFPVIFVLLTVYYLVLYILGRRPGMESADVDVDSFGVVIIVPARDEETVIADTVRGMLEQPGRLHIVVVDDGSEDSTADCIAPMIGDRVHILQRRRPNARQGKGRALNAGYALVRSSVGKWFPDVPHDRIIVGVTDADCLYKVGTIPAVLAMLEANPNKAAVQTPVSIRGSASNVWLLLQDMEFMGFYFLTQRARHHLGDVGMGGNGQFIRLSALGLLGNEPWSDCLTEDIDIAMALIAKGCSLAFQPKGGVVQQGLTDPRALMRQRTRWVHGHYQVWRRMLSVWHAPGISFAAKFDATMYLLLITMPMVVLADYAVGILGVTGIIHPTSVILVWLTYLGPHVVPAFEIVIAFATQAIVMAGYAENGSTDVPWYLLPGVAIIFALYATVLWTVATFCVLWKVARHDTSWAKTHHEAAFDQIAG